MKISRTFALITIALCIGFLAARWSQAQPAGKTSTRESTTNDDLAFHELESVFTYLQDTKQTNVLRQLNDYLFSSDALQKSADLSETVTILKSLREGQTNEVFKFLEGHMNMDIISLGGTYRTLPPSLREERSLKVLRFVRDYRTKFPYKDPDPKMDEEVAKIFKILDEKNAK